MSNFFPAPDEPYDTPETVEVEGALVFRVMTSETSEVAFSALLSHEGKDILYRFTLPRHSHTARQFFRRGGVKEVPWNRENFDVEGVFAIDFEGTVIGQDTIPEDLEKRPEALYVLENVKARTLA